MNIRNLFFIGLLILSMGACTEQPTKKKKMTKAQRIEQMAEMEILMTKNPITGEVPKEKLYEIRQQMIKEGRFDKYREGEEWISRGPNNVGGRTRAVLVDSRDASANTLIVGSVAGGLWRVTDADTSPQWERVEGYTGNPSIGSIAQDPNDPEIMYLGTGEGWFNGDAYRGDGIYKSVNGGMDWDRLPSTANGDFNHTQKLLFTADGNLLAATRESGLQMTLDGGNTWAPALNNTNQGFSDRAADIEITADGTLFAAMGILSEDGIYRSTDGGFTWTFSDFNLSGYERIELGTSPNDPNLVMAVLQDEESRGVEVILRSVDKGDTWQNTNLPFNSNGGNFARNQAWYDLSLTIDPNNNDVVFVGGINLYKTEDGGESWTQMSEWFSTPGFQEVHADQHSAQFIGNSSDRVMFSNDGGLYITQDATSEIPDIRGISDGYVSTQFYACAMHPEAGRDFFLAGAQDNGTNMLTSPGLGGAVEVVGGDGAFCHIGQTNPQFQVGASQGPGFVVSFSGNLAQGGFYEQEGDALFINPTEIDDVNFYVYASSNNGQIWRNGILAGQAQTSLAEAVDIPALGCDRVSALKLDPHNRDVLYLGTFGGRIVKVTNPRSNEELKSETLHFGGGFTRNIEVDHVDQNKLLATYSSFGAVSIEMSSDGGDSWRSLEGDLPDVPVRWGIFNPANNNEVLIATEIGIWKADVSTNNISWENISPQIGQMRVDMLKSRSSDLEVLASSYGRGLWTSSSFAVPGIRFANESLIVNPTGITGNEFCDPVDQREIRLGTSLPYETDVEVTIEIDPESTAIEGLDFELASKNITIPAGETFISIDFNVFDNATIDNDKNLILNLTSDEDVIGDRMEISLEDNDKEFETSGTNMQTFIGDGEELDNSIFNGSWEGARTQILYTREYLAEYGAESQIINRLVFDVQDKFSEIPYDNFNLSMALVTNDSISPLGYIEDADLTNVFSGSYETKEGVNIVVLDQPFIYDGTSNILIELCFDNDESTDTDFMFSTPTDYIGSMRNFNDGESGCTSGGGLEPLMSVPNIRFRSSFPVELYSTTGQVFQSSIEPDLTAYFSSNDSIMCKITNEGISDACFSASLLTATANPIAKDKMLWIDRIYSLNNETSSEDLTVTLYYPTLGSEAWYDEDIEGLFTPAIPTSGEINWQAIELISVEEQDDYIAFTMPYTESGFYTVGQEFYPLSNSNIELEFEYDHVRIYDLSGRLISEKGTLNTTVPTGIYIKSYINQGAIVKSEKLFVSE